jgi:hypothetical protein
MLLSQQPLDFALGDRHADRLHQRRQTRQCGLPLMILHQHETPQVGAEMAARPLRQCGDDGPPVRGDPTLSQVADRPHRKHKLLHQIRLVALEARSRRGGCSQHTVLNADAGADFAPPWTVALPFRLGQFAGLVHAAGLDAGRSLQALQPGDLLALLTDDLLQCRDFAIQLNQQGFKLCTAQFGKDGGRQHIRNESHRVEPGQAKNAAPLGVLPLLRADCLQSAWKRSNMPPANSEIGRIFPQADRQRRVLGPRLPFQHDLIYALRQGGRIFSGMDRLAHRPHHAQRRTRIMADAFNLYRFGTDEFAVGHLIMTP